MDSSVKGVYTEKNPPRRKAPVRKPREKKEKVVAPVITTLITPTERAAVKSGQSRLMAGDTITRAIKGAIARKAVKTTRASKAMDTAGDFLAASKINRAIKSKIARNTMAKMKAERDAITVPVPKTKTKKEKAPKYKISYAAALKEWNMGHNRGMWCNPRVGTADHKAVVALRL